jgi:hypothetical protein
MLQSFVSASVIEMMEGSNRTLEKIDHHDAIIERVDPKSIFVRISGDLHCELRDSSGNEVRGGYGPVPSSPFRGALNVKFNEPLGSSIEVDTLNTSLFIWE